MKLHWVFSTFAVGGPQRRFCQLVAGLGEQFSHVITAMDGDYAAEALLPPETDWRRAETKVTKTGFVSVANVSAFRRLLKDERPSLLLTSNWGCIEWFVANPGIPHLHFEDGFGPDEAGGALNAKRSLARRILFAARRKTEFVAPSHVLKSIFTNQWGVAQERVHYIPNGVDQKRFTTKNRAGHGDTVVIGTVAALRPEKRIDRLLRSFAALPDKRRCRLLIVGAGPLAGELAALADSLGVRSRVEFTGAAKDVVAHLHRMDIYALTSDTEQMPISLLEAMATGLPVAATNVGDVAAMVAPENRRFIAARDEEASFIDCLTKLSADRSLRQSLGEANAAIVDAAYSERLMIDRYRDLILGRMSA